MNTVLVVEDQAGMRRSLELLLQKEGFEVTSLSGGEGVGEVLSALKPDVVITDLKMEPLSGIDVLREVRQRSPGTEVIMMTAFGTIASVVEAMKLGAFDYITKPFENSEILLKVRLALRARFAEADAGMGRDSDCSPTSIIAETPAMKAVLARVRQIAPSTLTVLITGETGTGKGLIARMIHDLSPYRDGKFIAVNCSAVPEPLLESEWFGHEKGAFTGATHERRGLFEEADHGTIFLDEIGTLSANPQSKLLTVLQDHELRRVGSNRMVPVDARIIAATNSNLEGAVSCGEFRRDLFYRLNVARIHVPSLREHREDIPYLVSHFLRGARGATHRQYEMSPEAMALLTAYDYPGNIRELRNGLDWAVAIAQSNLITPHDLPEAIRFSIPYRPRPAASDTAWTLDEHEKDLIVQGLKRCQGNLAEVAKLLGIGRTTLWRKMREYGIRK